MLVLGAHNKDRKSTGDKANLGNPKVNRGCHPLTANRISADCVENSLGPSQYFPLGGLPYWEFQRYGRHNGHNGVSNHQPCDCLLNHLFRRRWKKSSKLRATGLCEGNSPVIGEFPTQRASNAENVSIWWRWVQLQYSESWLCVDDFFILAETVSTNPGQLL